MGLVCIARQTEYFIVFLLLVLQLSEMHLNPEDSDKMHCLAFPKLYA